MMHTFIRNQTADDMQASLLNESRRPLEVSLPISTLDRISARLNSVDLFPPGSAAQLVVAEQRRRADDLISVLRQNPEMARCVIRLGNSFECSESGQQKTIGKAVDRWGVRRCANWLTASGIARLYDRWSQHDSRILLFHWPHAVLTASLTSTLARSLELGCRGEEIVAALCLPIGGILREIAGPTRRDAGLDDHPQRERKESLPAEDRARQLETDLQRWFGLVNRLPKPIIRITSAIPDSEGTVEQEPLGKIIKVSAELARGYQRPWGHAEARDEAVEQLQQVVPDWDTQQCALLLESAFDQALARAADWRKLFRIVQITD